MNTLKINSVDCRYFVLLHGFAVLFKNVTWIFLHRSLLHHKTELQAYLREWLGLGKKFISTRTIGGHKSVNNGANVFINSLIR